MKQHKEYTPPVFIGQNLYIKPSYVVSIPEYDKEKTMSLDFLKNQENLKDNDHKGRLSRKAITGLRNSINWLCLAAKKKRVFVKKTNSSFFFKVNFITLTLPDTEKPISSADFQKQLLNPFLTYMRKYQGLKNYVWRLEFQANGKLHAHITTDTFLHLEKIREEWNGLLKKNGHLQLFFQAHGYYNPNSTDIHATKKIKNIAAYLAKYMSKKNSAYSLSKRKKLKPMSVMDNKGWYKQRVNFWNSEFNPRPITGRIWGCNTELSKANKCMVHIPNGDGIREDMRCLMRPDIEYKEIFSAPPKSTAIHAQFATDDWRNKPRKIGEVYFLKAADWFKKINGRIREVFDNTRWLISKASEQTPVFELA